VWIFTKSGLLSVVQNTANPRYLIVRARQSHHITSNFPGTAPLYTPDADYSWRVYLPREEVAEQIDRLITDIDYPNFKDAADADLKNTYMSIWSTGLQLESLNHARITTVGLNQSESPWTYD